MNKTGWFGRKRAEKGLVFLAYVGNVIVFVLLFETIYSFVFALLGLGLLLIKVFFDSYFSRQNQLRVSLFIFEFGVFYFLILMQRLIDLWSM
jgi:hypothetical protein